MCWRGIERGRFSRTAGTGRSKGAAERHKYMPKAASVKGTRPALSQRVPCLCWHHQGSHTDRCRHSAQKSVSFHSRSFDGSATWTNFMLEHQTYSCSAKIGKSIKLKLPLEGSDSVQMTAVIL